MPAYGSAEPGADARLGWGVVRWARRSKLSSCQIRMCVFFTLSVNWSLCSVFCALHQSDGGTT